MKKLLALLALLATLSCNKKKEVLDIYQKAYSIIYYNSTDSFTASAAYRSANSIVLLSEDASVLLNGQAHHKIVDKVYYWYGKGKPEANFSLLLGDRSIPCNMPMSAVGDYEIICPDTISRSAPVKFRIKGYDPKLEATVRVDKPDVSHGYGVAIQGDSCSFSSYDLQNFYTDGEWVITLSREAEREFTPQENAGNGILTYYLFIKKRFYFKS